MATFTALRGIQAPGQAVFGYQRGFDVPAEVVESWGLIVGDASDPEAEVVEGSLDPETPVAEPALARPSEADNRATWEAWARANGMDADEVAEASIETLMGVKGKEQGAVLDRPADSATKAEWVKYAIARGADEKWARDGSTTKADLQAYEPGAGDTVAVAATEANQG